MGTINAAGSNAVSGSGSVAYSIGQVFYTYVGKSVYNVAQGIQHEEINAYEDTTGNGVENQTEVFVSPNPTTDFVTIRIKEFEVGDVLGSYTLYDLQGKLLKQDTINETETQINLDGLSTSIYILQVNVNNTFLKTFKIVKK